MCVYMFGDLPGDMRGSPDTDVLAFSHQAAVRSSSDARVCSAHAQAQHYTHLSTVSPEPVG